MFIPPCIYVLKHVALLRQTFKLTQYEERTALPIQSDFEYAPTLRYRDTRKKRLPLETAFPFAYVDILSRKRKPAYPPSLS